MIHRFAPGLVEGTAADADRLGRKGANLCEMTALGLPVPPGFVLETSLFTAWREEGGLPDETRAEIREAMVWLESVTGRTFGGGEKPLLVSVRSGAPVSMPGMLDTILDVGLTPAAHTALATRDPRFAEDCRRRLLPALATSMLGVDADDLDDAIDDWLLDRGFDRIEVMDATALAALNAHMQEFIAEEGDGSFPDSASAQLFGAIEAVFESWTAPRARQYRAAQGMADDIGTAVTVQAMVFGNADFGSATGVAFTRDPSTGEPRLYGEYLRQAQGDDVVSGIRTPAPLTYDDAVVSRSPVIPMEETMPRPFIDLARHAATLEAHFSDAQEIEFTVEEGTLWLLQTRTAKRTARAGVRIAVEMAEAGSISRDEALLRVEPGDLEQLLHPRVDTAAPRHVIARGLPASPGAVIGEVVFTPAEAEAMKEKGRPAILVRVETSPEDIHGMYAAAGVLTVRGGMTSHAAVVARSLGKPCICGAGDARVDVDAGVLTGSDGKPIRRGDTLTIDGTTGEALKGALPMIEPEPDPALATLMGWADDRRRMRIRANADTAEEARIARRLGAEGIGLCRTEHAFFQSGRLGALQQLILSDTPDARRAALATLLPLQREDFIGIMDPMHGLPVCIRLLDPPIHEFLPRTEAALQELAREMDISLRELRERVENLREFNPMLGRRGCRIGVLFPEIYDMQVRAIFQAALAVEAAKQDAVDLEIMLPFVSTDREIGLFAARFSAIAASLRHESGSEPTWRLGVMIETPRAALRCNRLCEDAAFISFGTNDLTQMTYGLSRDDAGRFIRDYVARGALSHDPFHRLDEDGVGELLRIGTERGRATRPDVTVSVCGEHGGDIHAIRFCEGLGMDYMSCSPYRSTASRLAAAQATILQERAG